MFEKEEKLQRADDKLTDSIWRMRLILVTQTVMTDWGRRNGSSRARILRDLADETAPVFIIIFQSILTQGDDLKSTELPFKTSNYDLSTNQYR